MFDLTVSQLLQTRWDLLPRNRCSQNLRIETKNSQGEAVFATINGVQRSLQQMFELLSYVLSVGLHRTSDFPYLVRYSAGCCIDVLFRSPYRYSLYLLLQYCTRRTHSTGPAVLPTMYSKTIQTTAAVQRAGPTMLMASKMQQAMIIRIMMTMMMQS